MLEQIRKNSRSFIIWILFGIIIAVFIVSFGPQADQQLGCGKSNAYVLQVQGQGVAVHSWRFGNQALPLAGISKSAKAEMVMDLLLKRELLAQAAEKAGFKFSNDLVAKKIANGEFHVLGYPQDGKRVYFRPTTVNPDVTPESARHVPSVCAGSDFTNTGETDLSVVTMGPDGRTELPLEVKPGDSTKLSTTAVTAKVINKAKTGGTFQVDQCFFDSEYLERVIRNLGMPNTKYFLREQGREMLAASMMSLLSGGVQVSRDELVARFRHERTRVSIDYVKFNPATYKRGLQLSAENINKYLAENGKDVKKKYEDDKPRYKDRGKEVRVSHIFLRKSPPKPGPIKIKGKDDKKADGKDAKKADGKDKPAGKTDGPATADKKEVAAKKPVAEPDPKADEMAKLRVQIISGKDFAEVAKKNSEDKSTAWRGGLMDWRPVGSLGWGKELSEAAKTLEKGKLSEVITTPRGFHLLRLEDTREGTLTYDQVKQEIAGNLARDHYANKAAKADAEAALALVKGGKKLDELFERQAARPRGLPGGLTPEQLKNLPPELLQKLLQGQRSGALPVEDGPKVLAEWSRWQQQPAGGAPAKPAIKVVKKPAAKKAKAKPKAAAKKPAKDAKPKPVFVFPKDGLPRPPALKAPSLQKAGPFSRLPEQLPGVGKSKDMVKLVFEDMEKGQVTDKVVELPDGFVIIQLVDREDPDMASFAKQESNLRALYLGEKARQTVQAWVMARCREAVDGRKVKFSKSFLEFQDDKGKEIPIRYQPCTTLNR